MHWVYVRDENIKHMERWKNSIRQISFPSCASFEEHCAPDESRHWPIEILDICTLNMSRQGTGKSKGNSGDLLAIIIFVPPEARSTLHFKRHHDLQQQMAEIQCDGSCFYMARFSPIFHFPHWSPTGSSAVHRIREHQESNAGLASAHHILEQDHCHKAHHGCLCC